MRFGRTRCLPPQRRRSAARAHWAQAAWAADTVLQTMTSGRSLQPPICPSNSEASRQRLPRAQAFAATVQLARFRARRRRAMPSKTCTAHSHLSHFSAASITTLCTTTSSLKPLWCASSNSPTASSHCWSRSHALMVVLTDTTPGSGPCACIASSTATANCHLWACVQALATELQDIASGSSLYRRASSRTWKLQLHCPVLPQALTPMLNSTASNAKADSKGSPSASNASPQFWPRSHAEIKDVCVITSAWTRPRRASAASCRACCQRRPLTQALAAALLSTVPGSAPSSRTPCNRQSTPDQYLAPALPASAHI
mmetsp:Transcript_56247/g.164359  ORF Transcript_56247/g.164359 Transcript_56247/m.164359 type:complete len:314 (-) Transcript_56247:95-1036(-)